MNRTRVLAAVSFSCAVAATAAAQQPMVTIDGDDITLTGCVAPAAQSPSAPPSLVWTRDQLMLAGVRAADDAQTNPVGTSGIGDRVFYWLSGDGDLRKHLGQRVEIKGDLEDFEQGEIEVKRDGDFTEIELDLDGHKDKARVPTSWLGTTPDNAEFKIVAREVDVDDIHVLGPCVR